MNRKDAAKIEDDVFVDDFQEPSTSKTSRPFNQQQSSNECKFSLLQEINYHRNRTIKIPSFNVNNDDGKGPISWIIDAD